MVYQFNAWQRKNQLNNTESKPKAKRKLKNFDFTEPTSAVALVGPAVGGPANGIPLLIAKANNFSPEFIQKMQAIQVTMELPDFLQRFFYLWEEDAKALAVMMGYQAPVEIEDEAAEYQEDFDKWVSERFTSLSVMKSLNDTDNLPESLSKLTEDEYLSILNDQVVIEKALQELADGSNPEADTSTAISVEKKVEASASKLTKKNKDKNMTQATPEMVEKSALTAIEKAMNDTKVELQKALDQVKAFEDEKKQAVIKSKTDAVTALVKDAKQAEVLVKAALALDTQEDFEALVGVVKALVEQVDKSDLFKEVGASASADETKTEESSLTKLIKSKFNKE